MSDNSINSSTFTELELTGIAVVLYLLISPIHGISKITEPILKMFNIKSATSLLFFTGFLFGIIYYFTIELVIHPLYKRLRASGFKVGGEGKNTDGKCTPTCDNWDPSSGTDSECVALGNNCKYIPEESAKCTSTDTSVKTDQQCTQEWNTEKTAENCNKLDNCEYKATESVAACVDFNPSRCEVGNNNKTECLSLEDCEYSR